MTAALLPSAPPKGPQRSLNPPSPSQNAQLQGFPQGPHRDDGGALAEGQLQALRAVGGADCLRAWAEGAEGPEGRIIHEVGQQAGSPWLFMKRGAGAPTTLPSLARQPQSAHAHAHAHARTHTHTHTRNGTHTQYTKEPAARLVLWGEVVGRHMLLVRRLQQPRPGAPHATSSHAPPGKAPPARTHTHRHAHAHTHAHAQTQKNTP